MSETRALGSDVREPGSYLRYNLSRVDYTVTEDELARLKVTGQNPWKDFCLICVSIGIPCLINAIATTSIPFSLTLGLFLNYLIGILSLMLGAAFGVMWRRASRELDNLVELIKNKPVMKVESTVTAGPTNLRTEFVEESPTDRLLLRPEDSPGEAAGEHELPEWLRAISDNASFDSSGADPRRAEFRRVFSITDKRFDAEARPQKIVLEFTNKGDSPIHVKRVEYAPTGSDLPAKALLASYQVSSENRIVIPFDQAQAEVEPKSTFAIEIGLAQLWSAKDINSLSGKWGYLYLTVDYRNTPLEVFMGSF